MSHSLSKKIMQNILLILITFLPIFFISENILQLAPLKTFLVSVVATSFFAGILILKIKQNSFSFTKNIYIASIFAIIASMFLSVISSSAPHISLIGRQVNMYSFITVFSLFVLSYVVFTFFKEKKERRKVSLVLFILSVGLVLMHLLFILIPFLPNLGFFTSNMSNTIGSLSHLGIFAVFTVISSIIVLHFLKSQKLYKILAYTGIVSGIALLTIINMWSLFAILALFCFLYLILQIVVLQPVDKEENHVAYSSLIVLIFSIVFVLIGSKVGILLNTAFNMQSIEVRPTILNTLIVTGDVILKEPIVNKVFGVGLDRFNVAWLQYRPIEINTTQFWDTDFRSGYSYVSSVGVTQGIFGILAWLLFVVFSLVYVVRVYKKNIEQSASSFAHTYVTTGFLFFLIILIVSNPSIVLFATFFIFLGLFIRTLCELEIISFEEKSITNNPRVSFLYILIIVLLLISSVYVTYTHLVQYGSTLIAGNATKNFSQNQDVSQAMQKLNQAQFLFDADIYTIARIDLALFELDKIIADSTLNQEEATAKFSQVLQSITVLSQQVIAYDIKSYNNYLYILNVYKNLASVGVKDAAPQAIQIIDQISTFVPDNPTLSLQKAQVYVISKDFDRAIESAQEALKLKPNYVQAAFLVSQIQAEKGEINEAITSIKSIIVQNPLEPTLYFQLGLLQYNQSKYSDAILSLSDALTLSPEFNNAKYFLGLSYYKNNQTDKAILIFESLAQLLPDNQEVKKVLSNMKSGIDALSGIQTEAVEEKLPVEEGVLEGEE